MDPPPDLVTVEPHGTTVCFTPGPPRRRVREVDRRGTLLAALRWAGERLEAAWVRIPDGSWIRIEPRATHDAPWGLSDRLWHAARPGETGTPLTVAEAVDWTRLDRIPTLAEPGRLPPAGGVVILNLIATLARDHGTPRLAYPGPYPTEQLFLALVECFAFEPAVQDPLAAFMAGDLGWRPAPHERVFTPERAYVQLRGRVEKVVWRGRTYHRPDWQGVERHAPRRVRDVGGGVRCSLWTLGAAVEDHLELSREGAVVRIWEPPLPPADERPMPAAVAAGAGAVVAATAAPALAPFVRQEARALPLVWGAVAGDLAEITETRVRVSVRVRERLGAEIRRAGEPGRRAGLALAALREIALLVGDALRARAQARILALAETEQRALLLAPPPADEGDARAITAAVEALLADVAA